MRDTVACSSGSGSVYSLQEGREGCAVSTPERRVISNCCRLEHLVLNEYRLSKNKIEFKLGFSPKIPQNPSQLTFCIQNFFFVNSSIE